MVEIALILMFLLLYATMRLMGQIYDEFFRR